MRVAKTIFESSNPNIKAILLLPENPEIQEDEEIFGIELVKSYAPELMDYDLILSRSFPVLLEITKSNPYNGKRRIVLNGTLEKVLISSGMFSEVEAGTFRESSWTKQVGPEDGLVRAETRLSKINIGKIVEEVLRITEEEKWTIPENSGKLKKMYEDLIKATKKQMSRFVEVAKGMAVEERTGKYTTPVLEIRKVRLGKKSIIKDYEKYLKGAERLLTGALREAIDRALGERREPLERAWSMGRVHVTIGEPPGMGEGEELDIYLESGALRVKEEDYKLYLIFLPMVGILDIYDGELERVQIGVVSLLGANLELSDNKEKLKEILVQSKISDLERYTGDEKYRGIGARFMVHPDTTGADDLFTRFITQTINGFYITNYIQKNYRNYWSAKYFGRDLISYEKSYVLGYGYLSRIKTDFSKYLDRISNVLEEVFPETLGGENNQIKKRGFIQSRSNEPHGVYDLLFITNSSLLHRAIERIIEIVEREEGRTTGEESKVRLLGQENVYASVMRYLEDVGLLPEDAFCLPEEKERRKRDVGRGKATKDILGDWLGWMPVVSEQLSKGQVLFHLGSESLQRTDREGYHQVEDPRSRQKESVIQLLLEIGREDIERNSENLEVNVRTNRVVEVVKRGEGRFEALPEKLAIIEANLGVIMRSDRGMVLVASI